MLSEKIKEVTRINHQLLEKKLITNMRTIRDINDYANFLGLFYSFFGGLETLIDKHISSLTLPDYKSRRKTSLLADDLIALKGALIPLAPAERLPVIDNHYQAMGALYVIEGSTLGGHIICKMIRQQLNMPHLSALSFFNGYGDQTEQMWHTFKSFIDSPLKAADEEKVIHSANETFMKFGQWFDFQG